MAGAAAIWLNFKRGQRFYAMCEGAHLSASEVIREFVIFGLVLAAR
jgi:hypothetical protein